MYRTPTPTSLGRYLVRADRFDLVTRTPHPVSGIPGEPIELYYDQPRDQVFIVTANKFNHEHPKTLVVLDSSLKVVEIVDFPGGRTMITRRT